MSEAETWPEGSEFGPPSEKSENIGDDAAENWPITIPDVGTFTGAEYRVYLHTGKTPKKWTLEQRDALIRPWLSNPETPDDGDTPERQERVKAAIADQRRGDFEARRARAMRTPDGAGVE